MFVVRRWRSEVWFLAAVLIVVGGLDAAVKVSAAMSPVRLTTAWKLHGDVHPGQGLDSSLVDRVDVTADQPVLGTIPDGMIFVHELRAGDVIRLDDVARAGAVRAVPLDFKVAPDLAPGEYVDVYGVVRAPATSVTGSAADTSSPPLTLLGRRLAVVSVGSHVIVDVPTSTANAWAYVIESQQQLVAFISSADGGCSQAVPQTLDDAIRMLNQAAASGGAASSSDCPNGG